MRFQLLGKKLGMTQVYYEDAVVPVTVIQVGPCVVTQVKTVEKDGYSAIQVGFLSQKAHRLTKPELGHLQKNGLEPQRHLQEIRLDAGETSKYKVGDVIHLGEGFNVGDFVDVAGTSKGKGFQGVMKRHNFAGFRATHGTHEYFRHGGAIGCRLTPGRVFKGKRMGGQMGNERVTVQNLVVYKVDVARNLVFVRGAVPGARGGLVTVFKARKKADAKAKLTASEG